MKKLLTTLGLIGLATVTIANIATSTIASKENTNVTLTNTTIKKKTVNVLPFNYSFKEQNIDKIINWSDYIYFAIDNINLTSLQIRSLDELHKYEGIRIPGLKISYSYPFNDTYPQINGDTWIPKNRQIKSEDWFSKYSEWVGWKVADLYAAATMWYSKNGDLMMRLAYKAEFGSFWSQNFGRVVINTGSILEFY